MSSDVDLIVKAIEGLHTNIITDYILPVGTVLVSGFLGAGVAYYSINRQEKTRIEIEKINSINSTILSATEVQSRLISIKENYIEQITDNPLNRMLSIPPILLKEEKVQINLAELSFLAPKKIASEVQKWESITYISTLFSNFEFLLRLWVKRNEIILDIRPKIDPYMGKPLNFHEIEQLLGKSTIFQLLDFTELALMMTDELLIEISNFLTEFNEIAISKVNKKILNRFGSILKIELPDSNRKFTAKVPKVDLDLLSQIQGIPVKDLIQRYRPIYTKETNN